MAADVELLPLPQWTQYNAHLRIRANSLQKRVQDYARANVEHHTAAQTAEIEALRAEVAEARDGWHMANGTADLAMKHRDAAEARAERLAEALRNLLDVSDKFTGDKDEDAATWCAVNDAARAALEQETTNG